MSTPRGNVIALSGGVGGAKLCLGLADELDPGCLHVAVNTADDFDHMGLRICPDIDTLLYTLSGRANPELGWGLEGESWQTMDALEELGGETWFRLGDRDMATHLWRTQQVAAGRSLCDLTIDLTSRLGVSSHIYPMTEESVRTLVHTDEGDMPFQHYFVGRQCEPAVSGFNFEGITGARPNRQLMQVLQGEPPAAIVVCPSNPYVSIDPILQIPGLWLALRDSPTPVVLVSPIVNGAAIKGPTAKMMGELGVPVTAEGVAQHYCTRYPGLVDYFVVDDSDAALAPAIEALGVAPAVAPTVMKSREDKQRLARFILQLGAG
jgi:LPPG:FO 2-phospho-L-lactate transferase